MLLNKRLLITILFLFLSFQYFAYPVHAETCPNPNDNPCWILKTPMPTARRDLGVSTDSSNKVYAIGGYDGNGNFLNTLEVYDPSTNNWSTKSPITLGRNAMGFTFLPSNGKFYVAGGYNNGYLNDLYEYDPTADNWHIKTSMNIPRAYFGLAKGSNDKLYAIGGQTSDGTVVGTVEEYDPVMDHWEIKSSLPTPRTGLGVVPASNGKIYAIGGHLDYTNSNINVSTVEEYDPNTNTWTTKASMPTPRTTFGSSLSPNGNIYIVGGNIGDPGTQPDVQTNIIEEYNFITNTWTTKSPLPIAINDIGLTLTNNNRLYMIGGRTQANESVNINYEGFIPSPAYVILNVPILKQTDILWKNQTYDHAQVWSPRLKTIDRWGCALTSTAMILKFHGINKLPNGNNLNPGSLNTWLKNQADGYIGTGWLNWLAISRLSRQAIQINGITTFEGLEYSRIGGANKEKFKEDILLSNPDILEEPGHFVVGKGFQEDTIEINDPFYNRNTLDDGYSNTFLSLNRFVPSNTDLSYVMITTNPEVNITLRDEDGNIIGESFIQQSLVDDINSSNSNKPIKILYIQKPTTANYHLEISSTDERQSNLNIFLYDINGNVETLIQSIMVGPNSSNTFNIDYNKKDYRNSKSRKNINFKTLIDEIIISKKLKLINPIIADNLIKLAKNTESNVERNKKIIAKLEIIAMEKILTATRGTLIKEPSFSILIGGLKYLKTTF